MDLDCLTSFLRVNLKVNSIWHIAAAVLVTVLTPVIFSLSSLTKVMVAQPLEMYLSLTGILMLTPVFLPEENPCILDVVRVRKVSYLGTCLLRICYLTVVLVLLYAAVALLLLHGECAVDMPTIFGGIVTAFFLGSIGIAGAGMSGNTVIGYMFSMVYYFVNFFEKERLGVFYLFSMSTQTDISKLWLLAGSAVLLGVTFGYMKMVRKVN